MNTCKHYAMWNVNDLGNIFQKKNKLYILQYNILKQN